MPEDLPPRDEKTDISSGEPDDAKVSRPVRRGAAGKVPKGQLASSLPYYDDEKRLLVNVEAVKRDQPDSSPATSHEPKAEPLFSLRQVVATPGALDALKQADQDPIELLSRHIVGDWGEVPEEDKQENQLSVEKGFRILSAYTLETNTKIWIITESDRSVTTVLLPSEY
jgi:hypothetical protein